MVEEHIGILFAGEMGAALGALLRERGHSVSTPAEGRSPETCDRARQAGIELRGSLAEVVTDATVLFSLVPPDHAGEVAERVAASLPRDDRRRIFVDANSISPQRAAELADRFRSTPVAVVDASIHGDAGRLRERTVLYLSGPEAPRVAGLFGDAMRVRTLGDEVGRASRYKMTIAGVSKGLSALFLEVASVADRQGLLEEWIEDCRHFYPEILHILDRMLPTYAKHSRRRTAELTDMERTIEDLGLRPGLIGEARRLVSRLAAHEEDPAVRAVAESGGTIETFLHAVGALELLRPDDEPE